MKYAHLRFEGQDEPIRTDSRHAVLEIKARPNVSFRFSCVECCVPAYMNDKKGAAASNVVNRKSGERVVPKWPSFGHFPGYEDIPCSLRSSEPDRKQSDAAYKLLREKEKERNKAVLNDPFMSQRIRDVRQFFIEQMVGDLSVPKVIEKQLRRLEKSLIHSIGYADVPEAFVVDQILQLKPFPRQFENGIRNVVFVPFGGKEKYKVTRCDDAERDFYMFRAVRLCYSDGNLDPVMIQGRPVEFPLTGIFFDLIADSTAMVRDGVHNLVTLAHNPSAFSAIKFMNSEKRRRYVKHQTARRNIPQKHADDQNQPASPQPTVPSQNPQIPLL